MQLTKSTEKYYRERKGSNSILFGPPKLTISIHQMVNENSGILLYQSKYKSTLARQNDITLLKMVRVRQSLRSYLKDFKTYAVGHERRYHNFKNWYARLIK